MNYFKKHLFGIIVCITCLIYIFIIAIFIKSSNDTLYKGFNLNNEYCNTILESNSNEYKEFCDKQHLYINKTFDTITVSHQIIDTTGFWIFMIVSPTLIMILGTYLSNSYFRNISIENVLTRKSYKSYLRMIFRQSYVYALFLPTMMLFIFLISYFLSGHFNVELAELTGISNVIPSLLKTPIKFIILSIFNLFVISIFYINLGLIYIRYNKNYVISIIESSLTYYFICFFNTFVLSGIILNKMFKISDPDKYTNLLDMFTYSSTGSIKIFTLFCLLITAVSSIVVIIIYNNKEETINRLECNGGL